MKKGKYTIGHSRKKSRFCTDYNIEENDTVHFDIGDLKDVYSDFPESVNKEWLCHNYYLLTCFFRGDGEHLIDEEKYEIGNNVVFFISPGQLHQYTNVTYPCTAEGFGISFSENFLFGCDSDFDMKVKFEMFNPLGKHFICTMSDSLTKEIKKIYDLIRVEEEHGSYDFHHVYQSHLLSIMLITLKRFGQWNRTESVDFNAEWYRLLVDFIDKVEKNFKKEHSVTFYTDNYNIPRHTLAKAVHLFKDCTPLQIINERLLLESKRMLISEKASLSKISCDLGFCNTSHFVKFFKRQTGITPAVYRNQHRHKSCI